MTKKEMFETIATINSDNEEIVDFCKHEIELLANRSSNKGMTKTQKENELIMNEMVNTLASFDHAVTVTELLEAGVGEYEITNQKASALLRKLVLAERVTKTIEGRKALFAVA